MELTIKEMKILAKHYSDANQYSVFDYLGKERGEGSVDSLTNKGIYEGGKLNPAMKAVLDVLAYPERIARFQLKQVEVNMRKHVYAIADKKILVEFHRENLIISTFDTEIESLKAEISNHTGVAFQKHSQLEKVFSAEALLCFAGLADWLRRIALSELTGSRVEEELTLNRFEEFLKQPLKLGLLEQIKKLTRLEIGDSETIKRGLRQLEKVGLVETIKPKIEAGKSTILLAINFLIPNMAITLELYDLMNKEKVLMAREQIIQAAVKDNLSISAAVDGYALRSISGVEVLDKIIAYLSVPSLNKAL